MYIKTNGTQLKNNGVELVGAKINAETRYDWFVGKMIERKKRLIVKISICRL